MSISILNIGHRRLVIADPKMAEVIELARRAAKTFAPIFLCGESGSGKELIARLIHSESPRSKGPFVSINCAAVPDGLMESELFGHERGAFTGAVAQHLGKFERAMNGTLLLDEVSEMSIHLQAKLLRVLQEGELDRLGGRDSISINCRIVSTTNRDPKESITQSLFREDLFYRLNVIRIDCPPLRGRVDAIEALSFEFLQQANERQGKTVRGFSSAAMTQLKEHNWPGNIRELQNVIERALLLCDGNKIENIQLEEWVKSANDKELKSTPSRLDEVEKKHILQMLDQNEGNRTLAANELGISVRTLRNKLKSYQIA